MPARKKFHTTQLQTRLVGLLFIFLVLGVVHLFFPAAFAQVNCVITKVGNPKFPPPTNCDGVPENSTDNRSRPDPSSSPGDVSPPSETGRPSGVASDFVQAAKQIKTAYDLCSQRDSYPRGDTHDRQGLASCLSNYYTSNGYSQAQARTMETRRGGTLVESPNPGTNSAPCTQCLGYVSLASVLWTNNVDEGKYLGYSCAGEMTNYDRFNVGNNVYRKIGVGNAVKVQPGDIGIIGSACKPGQYGHILIVKEAKGNVSFIALESNHDLTCQVSDHYEWVKDGYSFYRRQ